MLIIGEAVRNELKVKLRTEGNRSDLAALTLNPAAIDWACCACNPAFTRSAVSQA